MASKPKDAPESGLLIDPQNCNMRQIGRLLDVAPASVSTMLKNGMPGSKMPGSATYSIKAPEAVKWFVEQARLEERAKYVNDLGEDRPPIDHGYEKARATAARADVTVLRREQLRGKLVPRRELVARLKSYFVTFRTRLLSVPHQLAPRVPAMSGVHEIQTALEELMTGALDELASNLNREVSAIREDESGAKIEEFPRG